MRDEWEIAHLGELMTQRTDFTPIDRASTYPVVGVQRSGWGLIDREPLGGHESKFSKLMRLEAGNMVYRTITAFEAPSAVVDAVHAGCFVTLQTFPVFRLDESRLLPGFMRLMTTWPVFHNAMSERCTGTVLRRKTLAVGAFKSIPIPLPPVPEQRRIVDMIGSVDDAIQAVEDGLAHSTYRTALAGLLSVFEPVPLGDVVIQARSGGTPSRTRDDFYGGNIPWLKSGEVENDRITPASEFITQAGLKESSAWVVPPGSTVVAMYGQGDTKGRAGYLSAPVATNQAVLALVGDPELVDSRFLLHALRSRTESLRSRAVGAAQPNLSKGLILTEPIPLPDLDEQIVLAQGLDAMLEVLRCTRELRGALHGLRSDLLSLLLSGEHTIPDSYDELPGA